MAKKVSGVPFGIKYSWKVWLLRAGILVTMFLVLYLPYLLTDYSLYDTPYNRYLSEKGILTNQVDTKLEFQIKVLQLAVIVVGLSAIFIQLWTFHATNKSQAYQRLIESAIKLDEFHANNRQLMNFFESMGTQKFEKAISSSGPLANYPPSEKLDMKGIKGSEDLFVYLSMAFEIWEQVFIFKKRGWIDSKTWEKWDRHLREVHIGQAMEFEYPLDQLIEQPSYRYFIKGDEKRVYDEWFSLFREWWHERQNYRYYHIDFVLYINSIIEEIQNRRETKKIFS